MSWFEMERLLRFAGFRLVVHCLLIDTFGRGPSCLLYTIMNV
jgi:hypothetical protein